MMLTVPEELRFKERFLQTATGRISSITVTTATQEDELPEASIAVRVTLFAPKSEQVNKVFEADRTNVQLSLELSFRSAATIVTEPLVARLTVIFLHLATGAKLSTTVTVDVHVGELPDPSVTVSVTDWGPA